MKKITGYSGARYAVRKRQSGRTIMILRTTAWTEKELFILIAAVIAVRTLKRRRVLTMKNDLFKPYDYDAPGAPKGEPPVRDKYCIGCKHLLRCEGKPRGVKECLCYEERSDGYYGADTRGNE